MPLSTSRRLTAAVVTAIGCVLFGVAVALIAARYPGSLIVEVLFLSSTIIGLGVGIFTARPFVGALVGFAFWCLVFGIIGLAMG